MAPSYKAIGSYNLPPYSTQIADDVAGSVQRKALDWLLLDPNLATYSNYRLRQRYALAVFYYQLDGDNWTYKEDVIEANLLEFLWLSYSNECYWSFILSCSGDNHVLELSVNTEGVTGSIALELQELTDLTLLEIGQATVSGNLPSFLFQMPNLKTFSTF
jgi:hypothetical protein